jgi:hypothetical protein
MSNHRNPRPNVANNLPADNFNPGDALELLYSELVDVEALAHAAGEAVTLLSPSSSRTMRRNLARLYALVTKTAREASAVLALSEQLVALRSAQMAALRAQQELERGAR